MPEKYHVHNRPNREIKDRKEIEAILLNGKYTTIALCRNNEPYIVTLSYGWDKEANCVYMHCAQQGLKIDFIGENSNVCATIIEDLGYVHGECAHEYRSVVFWGNLQIVTDLNEKKHGLKVLLEHLEEHEAIRNEKMLKSFTYYDKMEILRLNIGEIHGKAGR